MRAGGGGRGVKSQYISNLLVPSSDTRAQGKKNSKKIYNNNNNNLDNSPTFLHFIIQLDGFAEAHRREEPKTGRGSEEEWQKERLNW